MKNWKWIRTFSFLSSAKVLSVYQNNIQLHMIRPIKSHLTSHATHENCKVDSSNFDDWFLFPGPTGPPTTKILYFTNRSVTPFMSSINKKIGEITLRDFKVLFDRPGFYRFHFKSVDQEFGMVKEEVCKVINN